MADRNWTIWREKRAQDYNPARNRRPTRPLVTPNQNDPDLCPDCFGARKVYEKLAIDEKNFTYIPVLCERCDGKGRVDHSKES